MLPRAAVWSAGPSFSLILKDGSCIGASADRPRYVLVMPNSKAFATGEPPQHCSRGERKLAGLCDFEDKEAGSSMLD
ncbi:uncharacterized protein PGTG_21797 [Puccinia graminis f. sp. tritici CRL 75-36-700-3]|uniref:Uncharacterized protein n=1 Tax=Puccinia graminis f. sp. tritici (strain CRL 75-36-700-3 / race SCCL) TaxID=418459 RepID=H6QSI4_PUCGT|nr:uncharacterized protein PGTG_21797 [Puccinia graminis f. sp. tritici CRL 75-36-700-3]EHS63721.1 hypothetical protein PGTG_21797 [Puccinia graminis f. sp. tritici CRL 75-36-700-3]